MNSGIYKITDLRNGKIYIGRAKNLKLRKWRHWCFLAPDKYTASSLKAEENMKIHQAMMESKNEQDFSFEIVEYCQESLLDEKEQYYIKIFHSLFPNGYNSTEGGKTYPHISGEQHYNHKITQEEAKRIIVMLKEDKNVKEIRKEIPHATINIISNINAGRSWYDNNERYPLSHLNGVKTLSVEEVKEIRELRKNGVSVKEIAQKFHKGTGLISMITLGRRWKNAGGPIAKQFKFSKEEVILFRKKYAESTLTKKEIWKESGYQKDISYEAFCDMINGETYANYPMYKRPNDVNGKNQKQLQIERYKRIQELYRQNIYTKKEIAKQVGCSERTVYRALEYIFKE